MCCRRWPMRSFKMSWVFVWFWTILRFRVSISPPARVDSYFITNSHSIIDMQSGLESHQWTTRYRIEVDSCSSILLLLMFFWNHLFFAKKSQTMPGTLSTWAHPQFVWNFSSKQNKTGLYIVVGFYCLCWQLLGGIVQHTSLLFLSLQSEDCNYNPLCDRIILVFDTTGKTLNTPLHWCVRPKQKKTYCVLSYALCKCTKWTEKAGRNDWMFPWEDIWDVACAFVQTNPYSCAKLCLLKQIPTKQFPAKVDICEKESSSFLSHILKCVIAFWLKQTFLQRREVLNLTRKWCAHSNLAENGFETALFRCWESLGIFSFH